MFGQKIGRNVNIDHVVWKHVMHHEWSHEWITWCTWTTNERAASCETWIIIIEVKLKESERSRPQMFTIVVFNWLPGSQGSRIQPDISRPHRQDLLTELPAYRNILVIYLHTLIYLHTKAINHHSTNLSTDFVNVAPSSCRTYNRFITNTITLSIFRLNARAHFDISQRSHFGRRTPNPIFRLLGHMWIRKEKI
jgi:hypothetical protein